MTARYVVCLYLNAKPHARVERSIRRDSDERAVLYAQNWLHKHRLSLRSYGMGFDRWSVAIAGHSDDLEPVATGVDEIRVPTAAEQHAHRQARGSRLKITGSVTSLRTPRSTPRKTSAPRPMSRLAQAVADARKKVAENGNLPPLGSNPHSEK